MTTDNYIVEGSEIRVVIEKPTLTVSSDKKPFRLISAPVQGPRGNLGPQGEPGPIGPQGLPGVTSFEGTAWWYGEGVPGTILGSKPGDYYLNVSNGEVYKLGD